MKLSEIRISFAGFVAAHSARSSRSTESRSSRSTPCRPQSYQHSVGSPASARSRSAYSWAPDTPSSGGEDVYQICGFGRDANVGMSAAICSEVSAYASSRMTRSAEKPRPEPLVRATNRSRAPERSSMPSEPFDRCTALTCLRSSSTLVNRSSQRRNASKLVFVSCADHMIRRSPNRFRPASTRASRTDPLPFCLLTTSPVSKAAHCPAAVSPRPSVSRSPCQSSTTRPAAAASSMASTPADEAYAGTLRACGSRLPGSRGLAATALLSEVVKLRLPTLVR